MNVIRHPSAKAFDTFGSAAIGDTPDLLKEAFNNMLAKIELDARAEHGDDAVVLWNTLELHSERDYDDIRTIAGDTERLTTYNTMQAHVLVAVPKKAE